MVGWEGENICYRVSNDIIQVYTSADTNFGEPLSGWVRVLGGKGAEGQKYDFYYIRDTDYKLLTGVSKVDGNYYYFHSGGLLITGSYDGNGGYDPWRSNRYIYEGSDDNPAGYKLAIGLTQIGDIVYYFKPSTGQYKVGRQEIDGDYYAFGSDGGMIRDAAYYCSGTISGYADETGILKSGFFRIGEKLYYADWSGRILKGNSNKTWTVSEIDGDLYAVHKKGYIRYCIVDEEEDEEEEEIILSGKIYMVDTEGVLTYVTPETVDVKWAKPYKAHVTVRWTETQNAMGYEVFISTKKNGKYTKAATVSGSQTYAIIKNLKSNTKYYVKVRAYAKVQDEKIVGDYSEILSVKAPKTTK
jgi:hypothetical protein